jgi:hypothetical protein
LAKLGRFRHESDDIGLRDRLAFSDRQGRILEGKLLHARVNEVLAAYLTHRRENAFVSDAAPAQLALNHACTCGDY